LTVDQLVSQRTTGALNLALDTHYLLRGTIQLQQSLTQSNALTSLMPDAVRRKAAIAFIDKGALKTQSTLSVG